MGSSSIHAAITERRERLASLEAEAAAVRAELDALVTAARIMGVMAPGGEASAASEAPQRRGGKPQGAISTKWKQILADMLPIGSAHAYADVQRLATARGMVMKMPSIRDRVRKFVEAGYLSRAEDGRVSLTTAAITKFGLDEPRKISASPEVEEAETLL